MNKKIFYWIIGFILVIFLLNIYSNYIENKIIDRKYNIVENSNLPKVYGEITKMTPIETKKGIAHGEWRIEDKIKSTSDLLNELKVGKSWGAIDNITELEYERIKPFEQYMGYGYHININNTIENCYYSKALEKYFLPSDLQSNSKTINPYYHQGLFGKEEWGNVISGTNISNPNISSTFNSNGCHIYTLAYALSRTQDRIINPPEALVLGWYSGFWKDGMGPSENVENLKTYLGINAVTVSDDKENAKKEIDEILMKNGVIIVYLTKPFSFGNFHWVCITDKTVENGVDKYTIWTSTNINQMHQVYTFDYLYSKRVFEDWVRMGILPKEY